MAPSFPLGSAEGYSLLAQATSQIASAPSRAARRATAALAQLGACGAQLGAARARLAAGTALAAAGQISSAAQELLAAEHGFRTCGDEHLAQQARLRRETCLSGAAATAAREGSRQPPRPARPANVGLISQWASEYWQELHPTSVGGAYINFMMNEGQDRITASYRGNYHRLTQFKNRYDPDNTFHINQNIQPAGEPRGAVPRREGPRGGTG